VHSLSRDRGLSPSPVDVQAEARDLDLIRRRKVRLTSRRTIAAAAGESTHRPLASHKEKPVIDVVVWSDIV
jgi:hypothetical protein